MIAIRQIHEFLADVIEVPPEFRNRRTEVLFIAIDERPAGVAASEPESGLSSVGDKQPAVFLGSLPDFPERIAQGDFDSR